MTEIALALRLGLNQASFVEQESGIGLGPCLKHPSTLLAEKGDFLEGSDLGPIGTKVLG